jgi:hypothetical protein
MRKQFLKFETKYKICLWKIYFETGYSITNYLKYPLLLFGILNEISITTAIWGAVIYGIICFIIGYFWFKSDFAKASSEVGNRYNKLAIEIRKGVKVKIRKV